MEIELKYHLPDAETAEKLFNDEYVREIADADSESRMDMLAVYFDTEDHRLGREGITFRVRREGSRLVGTLKWNGSSEDGMHVREEINVPVRELEKLREPDPGIFRQSEMFETLKKTIGSRVLKKQIEIEFVRRKIRLDSGKVICELSEDRGRVISGSKEAPISEVEIELYSGSREEMEKIGAELAAKYGLVPENRSKFKQGLDLNL
ncbi:MAG: CYTH domain-containing protein [Clostridia bacterium]|nr:CYTH domain-containing protein [Clostridia bacterium]